MTHQEFAVRREALLTLTIIGAIASAFYLALGATGGLQSRLYPWDGAALLVVSLATLYAIFSPSVSDTRISWAAAWYLALASQPLFYAAQQYGIQHPVMALFTLSILVAALLVGPGIRFLTYWVLFACSWVLFVGVVQFQGWMRDSNPLTLAQVVQYSAFWIVTYVGTGGLAWGFARYLHLAIAASHQQTIALTQTLDRLATEPQLDDFLGQVLGVVVQQFGVSYAPLFFYNPADGTLALHIAYNKGEIHDAATVGSNAPAPLPAAQVPLWQALDATRDPVLISDPATDPRIINQALMRQQGIKTLLAVPLVTGAQLLGYFTLNSTEPRRYRREALEHLRAISQLITLAVQLTRLAERGAERAILTERNRMAREIHDTLAQGFTGILMQLEAAEDVLYEEVATAERHIEKAKTVARESLAEARRSVQALRPAILETGSWVAALQQTVMRLTEDAPFSVEWQVAPSLPPLPQSTENELYRIGQEAITNVVRHAHATHVVIQIHPTTDGVSMILHDNGRGIRAAAGFGIMGMRERAAKIGAILTIDSPADGGTVVRVELTIDD